MSGGDGGGGAVDVPVVGGSVSRDGYAGHAREKRNADLDKIIASVVGPSRNEHPPIYSLLCVVLFVKNKKIKK